MLRIACGEIIGADPRHRLQMPGQRRHSDGLSCGGARDVLEHAGVDHLRAELGMVQHLPGDGLGAQRAEGLLVEQVEHIDPVVGDRGFDGDVQLVHRLVHGVVW